MIDLFAVAAQSVAVMVAAAGGAMMVAPVMVRQLGWGAPPPLRAFARVHALVRDGTGALCGSMGGWRFRLRERALSGLIIQCELRLHRGCADDRRASLDGASNFRSGDIAFDEVACLTDDVRHVGPKARAAWVAAAERGRVRLRGRRLELELPFVPSSADGIARAVGDLLRVAGALDLEAEPARRFELVRTDPRPLMRRAALQALIADDEPIADRAARMALSDPAPEVRLVAARHLDYGPGLARVVSDPRSPAEVRIAAARSLLAVPGPGRAVAARALARGAHVREGRLAAQLATYAGCEDVLRELLVSWPDPTIRRTAIRGLAQIGNVAAVPLLQQVADVLGPFEALRTEIRQAIRTIQGRTRAEPGQLAVAQIEDARGGLTEVPGPGALSEAPKLPCVAANWSPTG